MRGQTKTNNDALHTHRFTTKLCWGTSLRHPQRELTGSAAKAISREFRKSMVAEAQGLREWLDQDVSYHDDE